MPEPIYESPYGDTTVRVIRALQGAGELKYNTARDVIGVRIGGQYIPIPTIKEQVVRILMDPSFTGTQRDLADMLGISEQELSMYMSPQTDRMPPRKTIIERLLLLEDVPTPQEVDHTLMQLRRPGLFTDTYDTHVNRGNYLLWQVFWFADAHPEIRTNWAGCAAWLMEQCGFDAEAVMGAPVPADFSVPAAFSRELDGWKAGAEKIGYQDYAPFRRACVNRYLERAHLPEDTSMTKLFAHLTQMDLPLAFTKATLTKFPRSVTSAGSRLSSGSLESIGLALGCDLVQLNRLLRESNYPLVYPGNQNFSAVLAVMNARPTQEP